MLPLVRMGVLGPYAAALGYHCLHVCGGEMGALRMAKSTAARLGRVSGADVAVVAGFACLLATLLIYSAAAMPFQRFEALPDFVVVLRDALRTAAAAGVAGTAVAGLGHADLLRALPVRVACALLFVAGNALFCAMALGGALPEWAFWPVGIALGLGCLGELVAWARILARYNLRQATGVVAACAVVAALAGWAQLFLSEPGAVALFMALSLLAACLPFVLAPRGSDASARGGVAPDGKGPHDAAGSAGGVAPDGNGTGAAFPGDAAGAATAPASGEAHARRPSIVAGLRPFLDMTLVPGLGLACFAMLMAVRGELFFESYATYVVIQVVVAALLLVCMLLPASTPLLRAVYRGLIPALGVAVLAFNYMSESIAGGSSLEIAAVMVLYTAAALLTLSTLAGMAHAAEFSCELVACAGVALFCLVTVATQRACADLGADAMQVRVLIVATSGLYAAGMAVHALWRGLRTDRETLMGEELPAAPGLPTSRGAGVPTSADNSAPEVLAAGDGAEVLIVEAGIESRCDALARKYSLTAREREVLGYLARGHNGVYISDELLISPNTVRTHIHNIYRKLDVTSREDIIRAVRG